MIKRIACFSRIKPSEDGKTYSEQVFSIFDSARVFNKEHRIVGAFVVHGQILLQVLEGDARDIAKALYRVNRDPRINDVSIILNKSFPKPVFTHWSIKVTTGEDDAHRLYLDRIKQLIAPYAVLKSAVDQTHFKTLFGSGEPAEPAAPAPPKAEPEPVSFRDKTVGMSRWPRPTRLRLNASLMKLCQVLVGHSASYQRLVSLGLFDSEAELDEQLRALYDASALEVFDSQSSNNADPAQLAVAGSAARKTQEHADATPRKSRFSQALRHFIQGHEAKRFSSQ